MRLTIWWLCSAPSGTSDLAQTVHRPPLAHLTRCWAPRLLGETSISYPLNSPTSSFSRAVLRCSVLSVGSWHTCVCMVVAIITLPNFAGQYLCVSSHHSLSLFGVTRELNCRQKLSQGKQRSPPSNQNLGKLKSSGDFCANSFTWLIR